LEVLISSHLLKLIPWAGHENSHVAIRKCHNWPEGSDDEVLHVGLISSLVGPRQVVCCHAKMSRLAKDENGVDAQYSRSLGPPGHQGPVTLCAMKDPSHHELSLCSPVSSWMQRRTISPTLKDRR
jgi:hypothetical protein